MCLSSKTTLIWASIFLREKGRWQRVHTLHQCFDSRLGRGNHHCVIRDVIQVDYEVFHPVDYQRIALVSLQIRVLDLPYSLLAT